MAEHMQNTFGRG